MSDDLIHDRATIRAGWDDDDPEVTRIARRVGAALNSGRDKAVVDVVLDEVQTLRDTIERVRALAERWRKEALERGPGDKVYTDGVAAMLLFALVEP